MPIRKDKLRTALSTIQKAEGEGYCCPSEFVKLLMNVNINRKIGVELPPIGSFMQYISQDLSNIEIITNRLAWQRDLYSDNQLEVGDWMRFAACDIDLFHVELRSIFDYLEKIIQKVADYPENVPDKGFNDLRNWLLDPENNVKEENVKRLGKDLADLVLSVDWFNDLKNIRDISVHQGGMTIVFLEKDRILFQIWKGYGNLISIPEIMYNENVVDFELYAGMYFGYLIAFLEEASKTIEKRLPPRKSALGAGNPRKVYRKLPEIYLWIEKVQSL